MRTKAEYPVSDEWFVGPIDTRRPQLPPVDDPNYNWDSDALCAQTDPEAFFPEKGGSSKDAKRLCLSCDVARQCLKLALDNNERFGVYGGLSERERRKIIKKPDQIIQITDKAWENKRNQAQQQEAA
jgi:WhiB family transcriptional regulator, redox-sensing transcriptional regulator